MAYPWTPDFISLFFALPISLFAGIFILWQFRSYRSRLGAISLLTLAVISLSFGLESTDLNLQNAIFWRWILGIAWAIFHPIWLFFSLDFAGHEEWAASRKNIFIVSIPLITILPLLLNEIPLLMLPKVVLDVGYPTPIINGPLVFWIWAFLFYAASIELIAAILLMRMISRNQVANNWQVARLIMTPLFTIAGVIFEITGRDLIGPHASVSLGLAGSSLVGAWAILGTLLQGVMQPDRDIVYDQITESVTDSQRMEVIPENRADGFSRTNTLIAVLSKIHAAFQSSEEIEYALDTLGKELARLGSTYFLALVESNSQDIVGRFTSMSTTMLSALKKVTGLTPQDFRIPREIWKTDERISSGSAFYITDPIEWGAIAFPKIPKPILSQLIKIVGITPNSPAIMVSLVVDKRVFGLFLVWGVDIYQDDIPIISVFANHIASAFEKDRLVHATKKRLQEQIALREAATIISSSLNIETVLSHIAEQLALAGEATSVYIHGIESETNAATVLAEYINVHVDQQEQVIEHGRHNFEGGEWADFIEMLKADHHSWDSQVSEQFDRNSVLYIPFFAKDKLIAYAELWDSRGRREFTPDEVILCKSISQHAAIALENARLYEKSQLDIAERLQVEQEVKVSLIEKEVLLKEIHHRVKNNMQVISSLLNLQSQQFEDPYIRAIFHDCQSRVHSMALVHDKLYQSKSLSEINFADYIHKLATDLFDTYRAEAGGIKLVFHTEYLTIDVETAIPCALIVNELLSNALKHAFPEGQSGQITIDLSLSLDNEVNLIVSDDGVGLPDDFDFSISKSLGLNLVNALISQINGSIHFADTIGPKVEVSFPVFDHHQ